MIFSCWARAWLGLVVLERITWMINFGIIYWNSMEVSWAS